MIRELGMGEPDLLWGSVGVDPCHRPSRSRAAERTMQLTAPLWFRICPSSSDSTADSGHQVLGHGLPIERLASRFGGPELIRVYEGFELLESCSC